MWPRIIENTLPGARLSAARDARVARHLTPDFDDWLRAERLQRTERLIGLAVTAGQGALTRQQNEDVRALVATLESLDPLSEPVAVRPK